MKKLIRIHLALTAGILLSVFALRAQDKSLVNTSQSPYALLCSPDMDAVTWTEGFWAERFSVCKEMMMPFMWQILNDPEVSHSFRNLKSRQVRPKGFIPGLLFTTAISTSGLNRRQ